MATDLRQLPSFDPTPLAQVFWMGIGHADAVSGSDQLRLVVGAFTVNLSRLMRLASLPRDMTGFAIGLEREWTDPFPIDTTAAVTCVETVSRLPDPPNRIGTVGSNRFGPLLESLIIGTWTAFEMLAGMLCQAVASNGKELSLKSLHKIRKSYEKIFPDSHCNPAHAEIVGLLADSSLDALSAIRNLLVHSAGRADETYRYQSQKSALAPTLEIGERLDLDAETSRVIIEKVLAICNNLIAAVDSWYASENRSYAVQ